MIPGKKFTPDEIVRLAWRWRWLIIVPTLVGGFGALLASRTIPNAYQSTTLIKVVAQRVPESYVRSTVTTRVEDNIQVLSQQTISRTRLEGIIRELALYPELRDRAAMEDVVATMRRGIDVQVVRARPGVPVDSFTVTFTYGDPRTAQRVTERLASLFIEENIRDRGQMAEATNQFLEAQLLEARARLEEQEKKLEVFRERHSGSLPTQIDSNLQAIQSTQMQLQALVESTARDRDRRLMLDRLYREASADPPPALAAATQPATAADALLPAAGGTAAQRLEAARTSLAQLEQRLRPEHPDVVRLQRTIRELEAEAAAEALERPVSEEEPARRVVTQDEANRVNRLREMRAEIESLDRQIAFKELEERRIRAQVAAYQRRVEAVPAVESEWTALTRDYDTLQNSYKQLLAKSEDSKVAANLERQQIGEQFRVVDPPGYSARPISPNRLFINAAGLGGGCALGLALVALLVLRDSSFHTEADVETVLSLPVLAVVPYVVTERERQLAARRRGLVMVAASAVLAAGGGVFWYLQLWKYVV